MPEKDSYASRFYSEFFATKSIRNVVEIHKDDESTEPLEATNLRNESFAKIQESMDRIKLYGDGLVTNPDSGVDTINIKTDGSQMAGLSAFLKKLLVIDAAKNIDISYVYSGETREIMVRNMTKVIRIVIDNKNTMVELTDGEKIDEMTLLSDAIVLSEIGRRSINY